MFNLVGVTCYKFVDRFTPFMIQYHSKLAQHFKPPKLILQCDIDDDLVFSLKYYKPTLWSEHLKCSRIIHDYNVFINTENRLFNSREKILKYLTFIEENKRTNFYNARRLSSSEHSLLHKHYHALVYAANQEEPTLILEDDALLEKDSKVIHRLKKAMDKLCTKVGFLNLSKSFLLTGINAEEICTTHQVARTDTTCAYAITSELARSLTENFYPYSLPIDFHLQYLFCRLRRSGYTTDSIFQNGSLAGNFKSTIDQHV